MVQFYSSETGKLYKSAASCLLAASAWLKAHNWLKVPVLSVALVVAGCSSFETRTAAEVSYISYIDGYQLNAPAMGMQRDAWPLERTEESYQRIVKKLTPFSLPVENAYAQPSTSPLQQQSFRWVKNMALEEARAGKMTSAVQTHYALLIWQGYGENSELTNEQREAKALKLLRHIPKPDAFSNYLAGVIKFNQKPAEALAYLNRAAKGGYAPAQALLARLYQGESGVPRNDRKARDMLVRLVNNKQTTVGKKRMAYGWLGAMSFYGVGIRVNDKTAFAYLRMAQSVPELQYLQGLIISEGLGTKADKKVANKYFAQASLAGSASATNQLALDYLNGQGVEASPHKARAYFLKASANGSVAATYNLGVEHLSGGVAPASIVDARLWFERAAGQGSLKAKNSLIYLTLEQQRWYDFSSEEAQRLRAELQKTAERGDGWSSYALGLLTLRGQGGAADIQTGYAWLNVAVALGYRRAAELRDSAALQMTRPELENAQALSQTLFDQIELSQGQAARKKGVVRL